MLLDVDLDLVRLFLADLVLDLVVHTERDHQIEVSLVDLLGVRVAVGLGRVGQLAGRAVADLVEHLGRSRFAVDRLVNSIARRGTNFLDIEYRGALCVRQL